MTFVEVIIVIALLVIAFASGMITADHFNRRAAYETQVALQKQYARLRAGVDADDTGQPYVYTPPYRRRYSASPEFISRLRTNGSATEAVKPQQVG